MKRVISVACSTLVLIVVACLGAACGQDSLVYELDGTLRSSINVEEVDEADLPRLDPSVLDEVGVDVVRISGTGDVIAVVNGVAVGIVEGDDDDDQSKGNDHSARLVRYADPVPEPI